MLEFCNFIILYLFKEGVMRQEENFCHVSPGDEAQVIRLGCKCLCPLSHLTDPELEIYHLFLVAINITLTNTVTQGALSKSRTNGCWKAQNKQSPWQQWFRCGLSLNEIEAIILSKTSDSTHFYFLELYHFNDLATDQVNKAAIAFVL